MLRSRWKAGVAITWLSNSVNSILPWTESAIRLWGRRVIGIPKESMPLKLRFRLGEKLLKVWFFLTNPRGRLIAIEHAYTSEKVQRRQQFEPVFLRQNSFWGGSSKGRIRLNRSRSSGLRVLPCVSSSPELTASASA